MKEEAKEQPDMKMSLLPLMSMSTSSNAQRGFVLLRKHRLRRNSDVSEETEASFPKDEDALETSSSLYRNLNNAMDANNSVCRNLPILKNRLIIVLGAY